VGCTDITILDNINNKDQLFGKEKQRFYKNKRMKILLVDDGLDTTYILTQALKHGGFDIYNDPILALQKF